jgi:hypothetical protein
MARQLEDVVVSGQLFLKTWDPDGDEWVRFQRPSRLEAETLAEMQSRSELVFHTETEGQVSQRDRTPLAVLESEMVAMCLIESSLMKDDELVFKPGVTCRAQGKNLGSKQRAGFYRAWHNMNNDLCEEIITLLQDWHPDFDWRNPDRGED